MKLQDQASEASAKMEKATNQMAAMRKEIEDLQMLHQDQVCHLSVNVVNQITFSKDKTAGGILLSILLPKTAA